MKQRVMTLRTALAISIGMLSVQTVAAHAEEWKPRRSIEIVVPTAPGGGLDLVGRTL